MSRDGNPVVPQESAEVFRLLVVEDDELIGGALRSSFAARGYEVVWHRTAAAALAEADHSPFDLVVLDLGLPDLDGIEACRRLRKLLPSAVVLLLTARTGTMDLVVGLEAGADDYLTKPVRLAELLGRVRAHLRRAVLAGVPSTLAVGDLVIDTVARCARLSGQDLGLRAKEFDLLATLAAAPGTALSRDALIRTVWDENWVGPTSTLDAYVAALRRVLSSSSSPASVRPEIVTVRGYGYRLEVARR